MCNIGLDAAAAAASPAPGTADASAVGVVREQLVIFLADTLRGTAEERAPLVLTMIQPGAGAATCHQVAEVSRWKLKYATSAFIYRHLPSICWSDQMTSTKPLSLFLVSRRPHLICSSDPGARRAPAGLATGENGRCLLGCQTPGRADVFRTENHR